MQLAEKKKTTTQNVNINSCITNKIMMFLIGLLLFKLALLVSLIRHEEDSGI